MNFDNTPAEPVGLLAAAWAPVRVAVTPWDTLPGSVANGSVVDGVTLATGDRFVVVGERDDAGIYVVGASTSTRATDADTAGEFVAPRRVRVLEGSADNVGAWVFRTAGPIVLGTTPLVFSFLGAYDEELPSLSYDNSPAVPSEILTVSFSDQPPVGEIVSIYPDGSVLDEYGGPILDESRQTILEN